METGAAFGFTNTLFKILEQEQPDYIAVTFDSPEKTFRHHAYEPYKATREKMPEELQVQLPYLRSITEAMGIPFIVMPGFEADDIMGTLAHRGAQENMTSYMVTGDKDFLQLLNDHIFIYQLKKGSDTEILGESASEKKWGIKARHVTDMLALMGDSSDNVPGVPGIGEKTASKLINSYGSIEDIYTNLDQVEPQRIQDKLREHEKQARMCKELVTIKTDVPVKENWGDLQTSPFDENKLIEIFKELGFSSLIKKISNASKETEQAKAEKSSAAAKKTKISAEEKQYIRIESLQELKEQIKRLEKEEIFAFDTETTGLDRLHSKIVGFSFCFSATQAFFVHFPSAQFSSQECWNLMTPILENPNKKKIGQNIKYDAHILRNEGIHLKGIAFDTMIASYMLNPNSRQHNLDALALEHLGIQKIPTEDLIGKGKKQISMLEVDKEKLTEYACEDALTTFLLFKHFDTELTKQNLSQIFNEMEIPLIEVLLNMERYGIHVDQKHLSKLSSRLTQNIEKLTDAIHKIAGEEFNIKSPKQLGPVLFEKLQIQTQIPNPPKKVKTTKTGYATDQETLENYMPHPIIEAILEYRNQSKLLSTYIDALPKLIDSETQNIHTSFNQTVASTGRLSSSDPNMQNIPIRNELGLEIRKAFIPSKKNWQILSADYSQVELRVLAHLAKDPTMIETFAQNQDIHSKTASLIFDTPLSEVSREQRARSKTINFGIIYGMGARRLAKENGISIDEAKTFIENYFRTYSNVKTYFDTQIDFAKKHGYIETMFGRRRPVPEIHSKNPMMLAMAERIVTNAPIQGSAADIIKIAMIHIANEIKKRNMQSKMLLQVHDELVFEMPVEEKEELSLLVKEKMEHAADLKVPLLVEIGNGENWAQAH